MLVGTTMALPALRLSGIYLAMATLGFAQFTQWVFLNWESVTYGAGGFGVPHVDFSPLSIRTEYGVYYLSWIVTLGLIIFAWNAMRSRIGRAFVAMRDGEIAGESLGVNLLRYKAMAFALSGIYAGIAGGLYGDAEHGAGNSTCSDGDQKAMVVVGGLGSIVGSVLGATCSWSCSRRCAPKSTQRSPSVRSCSSSSSSSRRAGVDAAPSAARLGEALHNRREKAVKAKR